MARSVGCRRRSLLTKVFDISSGTGTTCGVDLIQVKPAKDLKVLPVHQQLFPPTAIPTNSYSHQQLFPPTAIPTNSYSHQQLFPPTAIPTNSYSHQQLFHEFGQSAWSDGMLPEIHNIMLFNAYPTSRSYLGEKIVEQRRVNAESYSKMCRLFVFISAPLCALVSTLI